MQKGLHYLSATEAITKIKSKEISLRNLIKSHLDHIKKIEPKILAWSYFDENLALKQLADIEKKISEGKVGMLYGIPVGVKDTFNTYDMPTEMGSSIWKNYTPGNDARVVFRLRQEDAIIPGKTVTAEFAVHAEGKTLNPHDPEYSPGTSSSGSAAAVASYMVPLALGTQTGGSTIRPASYNGIYGMKPTFGLIPRTGMLKTTDTLDTVGFFSRTINDLKLMFETIRVKGHNYPFVEKYLEDKNRQNKKDQSWKIAFVKTHVWKYAKDYVKDSVLSFKDNISKDKKINVEEIDLTDNLKDVHDIHTTIYDKTLSYYFNKEYSEHMNQLSPVLQKIISRGNKISLEQYKETLEKQNEISQEMDNFFKEYDIILINSTSSEAPKKGVIEDPDTCLIWTFCGLPAINLPVFKTKNNMPFGAQIVARKYNDYLLLNFAEFLKNKDYIKNGTYPEITLQ